MISKPHHIQYYWNAESQRYRCQFKMLNVLEIVRRIIKGDVCCQSHHHFYRKLLKFL